MPSQAHGQELVLGPATPLSRQDFRDVWDYRELLWILGLRDVRVRYKQTALGVAWALFQPLTQMVIFTLLFHRFAGIKADSPVPYFLFVFAGLIVWTLFANGLSQASESLLVSTNLVTKVYFPRVILPLASVITCLIDGAIAGALLIAQMLIFHVPFHLSALLALPIAAMAALCAVSVGLWTSAINLQYRDVRYALPFFIQILVYATPVFYPASMVPSGYRRLLVLNPMAAIVGGFRAALFGTPIDFPALLLALVLILVVGTLGFVRFRSLERTFADRV